MSYDRWKCDAPDTASEQDVIDRQHDAEAEIVAARDMATLVAVFRTEIADQTPTASEFAKTLRYLASLMVDGWGAPDALFPQQVFSDYGPQAVLRALARAYEAPDHETSDIVRHP